MLWILPLVYVIGYVLVWREAYYGTATAIESPCLHPRRWWCADQVGPIGAVRTSLLFPGSELDPYRSHVRFVSTLR